MPKLNHWLSVQGPDYRTPLHMTPMYDKNLACVFPVGQFVRPPPPRMSPRMGPGPRRGVIQRGGYRAPARIVTPLLGLRNLDMGNHRSRQARGGHPNVI